MARKQLGAAPSGDTDAVRKQDVVTKGQLVHNVKDYGAVADGVADDTAEIHAARTAAGVGGKVFFPAGTYLVDDLTASVAGQTWELADGAVVKMAATGSDNCLRVTAAGVTVVGGTFDGSNVTPGSLKHGVRVEDADDFTIRNATVLDSPKNGIYVTNSSRVRVSDCMVNESYDAAIFIQNGLASPSNISTFLVSGNWIESASGRATGIVVRGESETRTVSRATISNNTVRLTAAPSTVDPACVGIVHGNDCVVDGNLLIGGSFGITNPIPERHTISNNVIRGFHKIGIELPGVCFNTTVTGNIIDVDAAVDDGGYSSSGDTGIILGAAGSVTNVTITGNTISGFSEPNSYGIIFASNSNPNGVVVSGNTITSTMATGPFSAMYFNDTPTDVSIIGNVIDTGSGTSTYGVNIVSGCDGLLVSGNQFSNIAVAAVNLSNSGGVPYNDARVVNNIVRNCGAALTGIGYTESTSTVLDNQPPLTSTATAAGTTTLTRESTEVQVFTGTTTQTCVLPTTTVGLGRCWTLINNSTGVVTVNASGGTTVATLAAGATGSFVSLQATPTTNAHWAHNLKVLSVSTLRDTNGNIGLTLTPTASAVNHIALNNSSSTFPAVAAAGTGTDVNLAVMPKGTGYVTINNSGSTAIARFYRVSSAVNYWEFEQSSAGNPIKVYSAGSDTNVSINVVPKGSGTLQVNANPVGVKVAVPASASATGAPGQWAADSSWVYICTAANTWVRGALATW